jgi:hypothetical protein
LVKLRPYKGLKQNSTIVIVPSTAIESMELGGLAGMMALTMGIGQDKAIVEDTAARELALSPMSAGNGAVLPIGPEIKNGSATPEIVPV